jgi:AcrR family transcriptional regulator
VTVPAEPSAGVGAEELRAADGRVPGRRGRATRQRMLDCTAVMLRTTSYRDLKVVDIAREAGTSPATFYQYFPDVEEAILVLADEATDDIEALHPFIRTPWNDEDGVGHVQEFVGAFMEYWDQHRVILRVRDLRAEEGDERFWAARRRGYGAIIPELTVKIESAQASGRVSKELNSYAAASAAMAMLERLLTYRSVFRRRGVTKEAMAATLAAILYETVTGHPS